MTQPQDKLIRILSDVLSEIKPNMKIKKPRKETKVISVYPDGFSYRIGKSNSKKVSFVEIDSAINELIDKHIITRDWYKISCLSEAHDKPCNFTSVGGVLEVLGYVKYKKSSYHSTEKFKELIM